MTAGLGEGTMLINPLEDLAGITGAGRADDLWRWLVAVPNLRAETDSWFAEVAFERLHRDNTEDAWRTAALLCTDPRWRKVTGKLVRAIEASGLVEDERLGELAVAFAVDAEYWWPVPDRWLADGTVVIDESEEHADECPPDVVVARQLQPPLRRWGVDHAIRHGRLDVEQALDAVAVLPARAGDHLLLGLLDACPELTAGVRGTVIELGVTWTSGTVRLGALEQIAARDGPDAAALLAARDRNVKIRRWGASVVRPSRRRAERELAGGAATEVEATGDELPAQPSLFDD